MPNGFDFVDQLFSGFIAFVYNLFETAFRLLTRPSRAPSQLLRRFRSKSTKQISGVTCLALSTTAALMLMLPRMPSARVAGVDLRALVPTPDGQVKFATVIPFLIGGIAVAIMIDGMVRTALAAVRVPQARRSGVVARIAYAFSFLPITLSIYVALFRFTPWLDWLATPGSDGKSGVELLVPMLLILRSARLVGTTTAHATVPAARRRRRKLVGDIAFAATMFVFLGAAVVGTTVTSAVINRDVRPAGAPAAQTPR